MEVNYEMDFIVSFTRALRIVDPLKELITMNGLIDFNKSNNS